MPVSFVALLGVEVVLRDRLRQLLQPSMLRHGSADQRGAFQLELVLVRRPRGGSGGGIASRVGDAGHAAGAAGQVLRIRTGDALAADDVHPRAVRAERDVVRFIRRRNEAADAVRLVPGQRDDGNRVGTAVYRIQRLTVGRQRHRRGRCAGVSAIRQGALGRARVNLRNQPVRRGVDHANLVGVVLGDVERGLVRIQCHPKRVAIQLDALDQASGGWRRHVDHHDFAVSIRGDVRRVVALHDHRKGKSAARLPAGSFVGSEIRTQVVLVSNGPRERVDDTDRVVVVVGDDERPAVAGDVHAAGIGLHTEPDAPVAGAARRTGRIVSKGNRCGQAEAVARLRVDVHRVVIAAGRVETGAIGREDQADMRVHLLEHLGEQRFRLVGAGDVVQKDVLR